MADTGWAGASNDVLVQLGPEVSHPAGQREGRQALVVAQPRGDDVGREVLEQRRVGGTRAAVDDPVGGGMGLGNAETFALGEFPERGLTKENSFL